VFCRPRHCAGAAPEKDVLILPITISYERLPELAYLDLLQKGKTFETTRNLFSNALLPYVLFRADAIAFGSFGACVNWERNRRYFHRLRHAKPVREWVDLKANFSPDQKDELFAHKKSMQLLAEKIIGNSSRFTGSFPSSDRLRHQTKPSSGIGEIKESVRGLTVELSRQTET